MSKISDAQKISRIFTGTLAAGEMLKLSGPAEMFYVISSTGTLVFKTSSGVEETFSVYQGKRSFQGNPFDSVEVSNRTGSLITYSIFYGFGEFIDNTRVFSVTGTVTVVNSDRNYATPDTISQSNVVPNGVVTQLLASDLNRGEVWLWTDEASGLAYWADTAGGLASPATYQLVGNNIDGFTKLKTKSAIYVYAAAGAAKVGAIVFKN